MMLIQQNFRSYATSISCFKLIKYNGVYDKLDQYKSIITLNFNNLIDNRIKKSSFSINDVAEVEKNTGITWNKEYTITQNKKNPAFEFPYSTEKDILYYVPEIKLNVGTVTLLPFNNLLI